MEEELSDLEMDYVGIHYTKGLEDPFDWEIAEIQAKALPQVLSDEEAREKKVKQKSVNRKVEG